MERYEKIDRENLRIVVESESIFSKEKLLEQLKILEKEQQKIISEMNLVKEKLSILEK